MSGVKPLTERDFEILSYLAPMFRDEPVKWHTPLEIGASNGSHHSATLAKLAKRGLVDFKQRGGGEDRINAPSLFRGRGSKTYRISEGGLAEREARFGPRRTRAEYDAHLDTLAANRRRP